jgi:uncharacterized protein (UPF0332 family)
VTSDASTNWRLAKTERFLRAAERALDAEDWETAVSTAYYAAYHSVIALVEARAGIIRRRWDHMQLRGAFRSNFGARGFLFTARDAANFDKLYERRLEADYESGPIRRPIATGSVENSRSLCTRIKRMLEP